MSRFFTVPENIGAQWITIDDRNDLHHMRKVLRLQPGDEVDVSDGQAWEYRARIDSLDDEEALLTILDKQSFAAEPATEITLYQGIPKQSKMETIIQKCVELGVHRIVPVFMDRTVVVDKGNFGKKIDRWRKVSSESVKQCRRGIIPEVSDALKMPQVMEELTGAVSGEPNAAGTSPAEAGIHPAHGSTRPYDLILIPYENEDGTTIKDVLREANVPRQQKLSGKRIAVLIGPEGGFSESEVAAVTAAGGHSVSLGRTTLRTETAGMAAIAMIMYELEL